MNYHKILETTFELTFLLRILCKDLDWSTSVNGQWLFNRSPIPNPTHCLLFIFSPSFSTFLQGRLYGIKWVGLKTASVGLAWGPEGGRLKLPWITDGERRKISRLPSWFDGTMRVGVTERARYVKAGGKDVRRKERTNERGNPVGWVQTELELKYLKCEKIATSQSSLNSGAISLIRNCGIWVKMRDSSPRNLVPLIQQTPKTCGILPIAAADAGLSRWLNVTKFEPTKRLIFCNH